MSKIIDFVIDSINTSRERLKMSIATFYITLLALYHWRVLAILFFGEVAMINKIEYIDSIYQYWTWCDYVVNIILLLLVSIVFTLLFPIIMWGIEYVLLRPTNRRKILKKSSLSIDRFDEREIAQHKYELLQIESGHKNTEQLVIEMDRLTEEITILKSSIIENRDSFNNAIKLERDNSKKSIENLQEGFKQVESTYLLQIDELKRQNKELNSFINEQSNKTYVNLPYDYVYNGETGLNISRRLNILVRGFTDDEFRVFENIFTTLKQKIQDNFEFSYVKDIDQIDNLRDFFGELTNYGLAQLTVYKDDQIKGTINPTLTTSVDV